MTIKGRSHTFKFGHACNFKKRESINSIIYGNTSAKCDLHTHHRKCSHEGERESCAYLNVYNNFQLTDFFKNTIIVLHMYGENKIVHR